MENEVQEPAVQYNYLTADNYLQIDRASVERHELHEGTLITMQGVSIQHGRITSRIVGRLEPFLRGKPCEVLPGEIRLKTPGVDTFTYPDCMIICGKPETTDDKYDIVKNPSVVFEILSPSTQDIDLGRKFFYYLQIPSLKEYITISSTEIMVRVSRKQPDNSWKFEQFNDSTTSFLIETIGYAFSLNDLYALTNL